MKGKNSDFCMKNKHPLLTASLCNGNKETVPSEASSHLLPTSTAVTHSSPCPDLRERRKERQNRILGAFSPLSSLPIKFKMHHFPFLQKLFANFLVKTSLICTPSQPPAKQNYVENPREHGGVFFHQISITGLFNLASMNF